MGKKLGKTVTVKIDNVISVAITKTEEMQNLIAEQIAKQIYKKIRNRLANYKRGVLVMLNEGSNHYNIGEDSREYVHIVHWGLKKEKRQDEKEN